MNKRGVKAAVVAAVAVGLTGLAGATAWAETVSPGIEQPVLDLGVPDGLLGGSSVPGTPADGNHSSAEGRDGESYRDRYYEQYGGSAYDDSEDDGYWRESDEDASSDEDSESSDGDE